MPTPGRYRIGFDIGGTFTDFVLLDTQRHRRSALHKCLTTPHDPAVGALAGLDELLHAARLALADSATWCTARRWSPTLLIERKRRAARR